MQLIEHRGSGVRTPVAGRFAASIPGLAMLALLALLALLLATTFSRAEEAVKPGPVKPGPVEPGLVAAAVDFQQRVQPIFAKHCAECHSAEFAELELNLASVADVLAGSETGPVLSPGKPAESLLVQVLAKAARPHMPPKGQLSPDEIAVVEAWVKSLPASTPVGKTKVNAADRAHWAFQPIQRAELPAVNHAHWANTPVDRFILARLEAAGITPGEPASNATLLRRVYFDLIGLPPTPEEVQAFEQDRSPDAYERVVDRLLASPHYGERWGRHWLDLARYADSSGFHNDLDRPGAWHYRDYVIESFNADIPYRQFVREQLAGDLVPSPTRASWIATGFNRTGPSNEDNMGMGLAKEQYRFDELDGVISTTSNVFLGLTLGCARCHDHKYDPITQRDYYRFLAFFDDSDKRLLDVANFTAEHPTLVAAAAKKSESPQALVLTNHGVKPRTTRILYRGDVRNVGPEVEPGVPEVLCGDAFASETAGDEPTRSTTEPSADSPPATSRLDLADWITDDANPLSWRVMANRLWHYHFGQGLVSTPSNFGRLAEPPSHPELLDWLADELRTGGQLKPLHRLIVTSAVYRQSPAARSAAQAIDPDNRLLWRMPRRRLEAEPLRDAFLSVAGNLNRAVGGPGIKPRIRAELLVASQRNKWPTVVNEGPQHWRRSVYVYVKRQLQLPLLELFDAPATTHSCAKREESLVPTQALVLMNDDFLRDQAKFFAERVVREAEGGEEGGDVQAQVERALWIALCAEPTAKRVHQGAAFVANQAEQLAAEGLTSQQAERGALIDFCHVLMNLSEFVYVD